jgi:hypothetical protein
VKPDKLKIVCEVDKGMKIYDVLTKYSIKGSPISAFPAIRTPIAVTRQL